MTNITNTISIIDIIAGLNVSRILNELDIATLQSSADSKLTAQGYNTELVKQTVDEINSRVIYRFYANNKDISGKQAFTATCKLIPSIAVRIDVLTDDISYANSTNKIPQIGRMLTKSEKENIGTIVQAYLYDEISKNEACRRLQAIFGIDGKIIQKEFRTVCSDFCTRTQANTNTAKFGKKLNMSYIMQALSTALHLLHYRTKYTATTKSLAIDIDYIVPTQAQAQPAQALTAQAIETITAQAQPKKSKK